MNPNEVLIGKERASEALRKPYIEALNQGDAGRIELAAGDTPEKVKRYLAEAARSVGVGIRSSWEDEHKRVLFWKKVAAKKG